MSHFYYGSASETKLSEVHPLLKKVMRDALDTGIMDISIIEGHRNEARQNRLYDIGKSKKQWPDSKHNKMLSEAVDATPYIDGEISWDKNHCYVLAGIVLACAARRGVKVRWGGCWSGNPANIGQQSFEDLCHYEIVGE